MALHAKDIKTIDDMQDFVEGCINDYDDKFMTKQELIDNLRDYTFRVIELSQNITEIK